MAKRRKASEAAEPKTISRGRHEANCTICAHPDREEIEREFVDWQSPTRIAMDYGLASRVTVYRHARAMELFAKRDRNVRAALAKIIEKSGEVPATAQAVVAAIQAFSKINSAGHWIDRSEFVNLNELFERMTREELESYARDGKLPDWFTPTLSVTHERSRGEGNDAKAKDLARSRDGLRDTLLSFRPGDFPLGSAESRAAARLQLENKRDDRERIEIVMDMGAGRVPHAEPWRETPTGLSRSVHRPTATVSLEDPAPVCPSCGAPYREDSRGTLLQSAGALASSPEDSALHFFLADCLKKHIPDFGMPSSLRIEFNY